MINSVSVIVPEKNDAISRIKKFMSNEESGIVLSAKEEEILGRLIYANALLSERKFTRDEIAIKIKDKFGVSIHTGRNDVDNTYSLFVKVTEDYKRYTLFHQIEFIDKKILAWSSDRNLAPLIPKLLAERTRTIMAMPVEAINPDVPAPIILLTTTKEMIAKYTGADALAKADAIIELEKKESFDEAEIVAEDE